MSVARGARNVKLQYRLQALSRLAERARSGEVVYLWCDCAGVDCHGDAIVEWVRPRSYMA